MQMQNYKKFFFWWVSVLLVGTGVFWANHYGFIQSIWKNDVTYITSLIAASFIGINILLGWVTFKAANPSFFASNKQKILKVYDTGWFMSEIMMALGMFGTVIGLILMLSTSFVGTDPSQMQSQLGGMWAHMGLALYTNAIGIIASIVLKLQVYFIGYDDEAQEV
jgi:hypothetical protein